MYLQEEESTFNVTGPQDYYRYLKKRKICLYSADDKAERHTVSAFQTESYANAVIFQTERVNFLLLARSSTSCVRADVLFISTAQKIMPLGA